MVIFDLLGLAIGLSLNPMPGTDCILPNGVDWMAPKPGWMEGVLTTVGCRGYGGAAVAMGRRSGCSSSSSSSSSTSK